MNWDTIYRTTKLQDLDWFPGEPDEVLQQAVIEARLRSGSALDVGSGQGTDAIYLAKKGFQVTAIDLSAVAREVALQAAAKAGVKIDYVVGSALELPFGDAQFDTVVERGCFHHIALADRATYAREIGRVLKPGGTYLYRSFCWKSQANAPRETFLTENVVRPIFDPYFRVVQFGDYMAKGQNGRSAAAMHWALMHKKR